MIFWSNYKMEAKIQKIGWAGVRGIVGVEGKSVVHIRPGLHPWYLMFLKAGVLSFDEVIGKDHKKLREDVYMVYDGNSYWPLTTTLAANAFRLEKSRDLGLGMSVKRALDITIKRFVDRGMKEHPRWVHV